MREFAKVNLAGWGLASGENQRPYTWAQNVHYCGSGMLRGLQAFAYQGQVGLGADMLQDALPHIWMKVGVDELVQVQIVGPLPSTSVFQQGQLLHLETLRRWLLPLHCFMLKLSVL